MDIQYLLFSYQGRIRRLHYWLAAIGTGAVIGVLFNILLGLSGWPLRPFNPIVGLVVAVLWALDVYIGLALGAKRCHDRDKSAWFLLVGLIPLIGWVWLLVELGFLDGTQGPNRFGPSPKGVGEGEAAPAS